MKIIESKFEGLKKVKSFKFNYQNRPVDEDHIRDLRTDLFKDGDWVQIQAVIVNILTMNILDGQHRWSLYLQLVEAGLINPLENPLYVEYVEMNPDEEHKFITDLQNARRWETETFCESYVSGNNPNYVALKNWIDNGHILCSRVNKAGNISSRAYRLANIILTGDRNEQHLKNGQFIFSKEDAKYGDIIHKEMLDIIKALKLDNTVGRSGLEGLASAWRVMRNTGYPIKEWVKELSKEKYKGGPKSNKTWGLEIWKDFLAPANCELMLKKMGEASA